MKLTLNLQSYFNRSATRAQQFYTIFIANNHAPFHLWKKKKLVKYQKVPNIMTTVAGSEVAVMGYGIFCF